MQALMLLVRTSGDCVRILDVLGIEGHETFASRRKGWVKPAFFFFDWPNPASVV
jgi:hypothetical protein